MDGRVPRSCFWGKLEKNAEGGTVRWHPLVDHCTDVAVVFQELLTIPVLRSRLESSAGHSLDAPQVARLATLAFLHDIGKCNWGFQAKRDSKARETAGHIMEAAALLWDDRIYRHWPPAWKGVLATMCGWFVGADDELFSMLLAAISHHGRPVSENDHNNAPDRSRWWQPHAGVDPMLAVTDLVESVQRAFPAAFDTGGPAFHATPALQQRFAGLVMLADWIGSDTQFFPYRGGEDEDRRALAQCGARRALAAIGIAPSSPRTPASFGNAFGFSPNPLQRRLAHQLAPEDATRLVLAESDTGSGKTEAALAWYLRLYESGLVDGLYFALPTRVAAREIYGRVQLAVERAFPEEASRPRPVLLAVPGYVRADGQAVVLPDPEGRLWEDDAAARRRERFWSAEHPKRFLAAPVAVGTIDQALLSVLKVKHSLLRSVCLDRHLLVVDEVHASDPYMREVLRALLNGHLSRAGWALLLSATLGETACAGFFGREQLALEAAAKRPYPVVTTRTSEITVPTTGRRKKVRVNLHEYLDEVSLLPALQSALAAGARVLVVCNTVKRANALLRAVEADRQISASGFFRVNGVVCPHHGRFAREDREVMDAAVSRRLGKDSTGGPVLLIGTQTLEQSLDIDADWLVSDLCPMDVLLQRIGRLHRHERVRRPTGFEHPTVHLRVPEDADLARYMKRDGSLAGPAGIGWVYEDGRILQRTLDVLRARPDLVLPDDNRWLVEQATHPEALAGLEGEAWSRHASTLEGQLLAKLRAAVTGTLDEKPFGELHYNAPDERVTTRLGEGTVQLPLAHPMSHPFGNLIRNVSIPAHMLPRLESFPDCVAAEASDQGFHFELGGRRYRYTRFGLEIDDA